MGEHWLFGHKKWVVLLWDSVFALLFFGAWEYGRQDRCFLDRRCIQRLSMNVYPPIFEEKMHTFQIIEVRRAEKGHHMY